jgi:hypothetical protein
MSNSNTPESHPPRIPFPHDTPHVWFLTSGCNPIAASIVRQLLEHGDSVVACMHTTDYSSTKAYKYDVHHLLQEVANNEEWKARLRVVRYDIRLATPCSSPPEHPDSSLAQQQNANLPQQKLSEHLVVSISCSSVTVKHFSAP